MKQNHTHFKKTESAVSEVVGVILMLCVTVLIAGIVVLVISSQATVTEKGISADIRAVSAENNMLTLELMSGDSFSINDIEVVLGIREDKSVTYTIRSDTVDAGNKPMLITVTGGDIVELGDSFRVKGTGFTDGAVSGTKWNDFKVKAGQHMTYAIYDRTGKPVSTGEIRIPKS